MLGLGFRAKGLGISALLLVKKQLQVLITALSGRTAPLRVFPLIRTPNRRLEVRTTKMSPSPAPKIQRLVKEFTPKP